MRVKIFTERLYFYRKLMNISRSHVDILSTSGHGNVIVIFCCHGNAFVVICRCGHVINQSINTIFIQYYRYIITKIDTLYIITH